MENIAKLGDHLFDELTAYTPKRGISAGARPTNIPGIIYWTLRNGNVNSSLSGVIPQYNPSSGRYLYPGVSLRRRDERLKQIASCISNRTRILHASSAPLEELLPRPRHRTELLARSPKEIRQMLRYAMSRQQPSSLNEKRLLHALSIVAVNGYMEEWYSAFNALLRLEKYLDGCLPADRDFVIAHYSGPPFNTSFRWSHHRWTAAVVGSAANVLRGSSSFRCDHQTVERLCELLDDYDQALRQAAGKSLPAHTSLGRKALIFRYFARNFRLSV